MFGIRSRFRFSLSFFIFFSFDTFPIAVLATQAYAKRASCPTQSRVELRVLVRRTGRGSLEGRSEERVAEEGAAGEVLAIK